MTVRAGFTPPAKRSIRLAAVVATFMVAAASACSTDAAPGDRPTAEVAVTDEDSMPPRPDGRADPTRVVDLGRLEHSRGPGSRLLPILERLPVAADLGEDWISFPVPTEHIASCAIGEEEAWAARLFVVPGKPDAVSLRAWLFDSSDAAVTAADVFASSGYEQCIEDGIVAANERLAGEGAFEAELISGPGPVEASLVPERGGATRRMAYRLNSTGGEIDLDTAFTYFVEGPVVVATQTELTVDRHAELQGLLLAATPSMADITVPGPGREPVDGGLDRLRRAVVDDDERLEFYDLLLAGTLDVSNEVTCVDVGAPTVMLRGPVWATVNTVSAVDQIGMTFGSEQEAIEVIDAMRSLDLQCLFRESAGMLAGEVSFDGGDLTVEEHDGRTVLMVDISVTQMLGGGQEVEADVAELRTMTRVGSELIGWRFIGIRGDEPDLVQLTLEAAARSESGR